MAHKRVTIKDLARELNVSIGTVDRALHGRSGISEETREAVLAKAHERGYKVNKVARSLSRRKKTVIGAIFPREIRYFYADIERGVFSAEESLRDFNVEVDYRPVENLGSEVEKQIGELIRRNVDGLIISPGHRSRLNSMIDELADKGIPVVTVATDAPESKRLTTVCTNPYKNGEIAGELMARMLAQNSTGYSPKVAIMTGMRDVVDHEEKIRGFKDSLSLLLPTARVISVTETFDNEQIAFDETAKLIRQTPDLAGIYINTANTVGPCRAVYEAGLSGRIKICGTDVYDEMKEYILNGTMQFAIYQDPYRQGYKAVKILYEYICEDAAVDHFSYINPVVVLRSNLDLVQPTIERGNRIAG